jgi:hypothetical protein
MFGVESIELHCKRLESKPEPVSNDISKGGSYRAIQYFADSDTDTYRLQKLD